MHNSSQQTSTRQQCLIKGVVELVDAVEGVSFSIYLNEVVNYPIRTRSDLFDWLCYWRDENYSNCTLTSYTDVRFL